MKKYIIQITIFLSLFSVSFISLDENDRQYKALKQARLKALQENIMGKEYIYDLTKIPDCNKTRIKYLGQIRTNKNRKFKILTSFFVHGQSCRGSSCIVIFDTLNRYVGHYFVSMPVELPDTLINNSLSFKSSKNCKTSKTNGISFARGLPETIAIDCNNSEGNYSFSTEE